jgi:curved DNA-binding protein CbpA
MAKKHHPGRTGSTQEQKDLFELISTAYETIKTEYLRNEYNKYYGKKYVHDFYSLKKGSNIEIIPKTNDEIKLLEGDFRQANDDMNKKYEEYGSGVISKVEAQQKMQSYKQQRELSDVEYKPRKLFDSPTIDNKKFNAIFDQVHKQENQIIQHSGMPAAWEISGSLSYGNFSDNVYEGGNYNSEFNPIDLNDIDVNNVSGGDYYDNHRNATQSELNKKMAEYRNNTSTYNNMSYMDYSAHDTGGYGILDQVADLTIDDFDSDSSNLHSRYQKLIASRNTI